jgi:hypothetical protein
VVLVGAHDQENQGTHLPLENACAGGQHHILLSLLNAEFAWQHNLDVGWSTLTPHAFG